MPDADRVFPSRSEFSISRCVCGGGGMAADDGGVNRLDQADNRVREDEA